jgi:NAD(P)-dependent dehydrogenase (short-subunit alcohol dehydrogenase family)
MEGRQVLLAGGTGGLGLGVTPTVLYRGAEVTIPYHTPQTLDRLKGFLSPADLARIRFVYTDLRQEASVEQLVHTMGRVDVLIQLVGGFHMGKTHEYSYEQWQQDLELNLNITFLLCKHSLASMVQHGYGRIVTIASRAAVEPGAQLAAYSASKAGVIALTRSIAEETKGTDITANVVLPSIIDTPANRAAMGSYQASRWVKPESLAEVICFLASDAARDVRGAVVPVYGSSI